MSALGHHQGGMQSRAVEVLIGPAGGVGKAFRGGAQGFAIEGEVSYSLDDVPKARISLYNPSDEAVGMALQGNAVVALAAGYGGVQRIFDGTPVRAGVKIRREGATRVLEIEAQDSYRSLITGKPRVHYGSGVRYTDVVRDVAASIGLKVGVVQIPDSLWFHNGFSASGDATQIFQRIAISSQTFWGIESGAVNFLYRDESREPGSEKRILFSSKEGNLIGEPQWKDDGVIIKGLLDPDMRPGMAFQFESLAPTGGGWQRTTQVARDVSFSVSSRGPAFYVTMSSGSPKGSGGRPKTYDRGGAR